MKDLRVKVSKRPFALLGRPNSLDIQRSLTLDWPVRPVADSQECGAWFPIRLSPSFPQVVLHPYANPVVIAITIFPPTYSPVARSKPVLKIYESSERQVFGKILHSMAMSAIKFVC